MNMKKARPIPEWLTKEHFDYNRLIDELTALHNSLSKGRCVFTFEPSDPRAIYNTDRPSDYALAGSTQVPLLFVQFMNKHDPDFTLPENGEIEMRVKDAIKAILLHERLEKFMTKKVV